MRIVFKPNECVGCEICTLICSLKHNDITSLQKGRIKISRNYPTLNDPLFKATYCRHCKNARCIKVCPTGALSEDENGQVLLDHKKCNKCGECITACPFGAIWLDEKTNIVFKCDLCGGEPWCVKWCPHGALEFKQK